MGTGVVFGTVFPNKFDVKGMLFRTDQLILYKNSGTFAVPVFESLSVGAGGVVDYGSGIKGALTNPAIAGGNVIECTSLDITSPITITGQGAVIIRCTGTVNITSTLTMSNESTSDNGIGGTAGTGGGVGGAGGESQGLLLIMANAITGTGTITGTGLNGGNGGPGTGDGTFSGGGAGGAAGLVDIINVKQVAESGRAFSGTSNPTAPIIIALGGGESLSTLSGFQGLRAILKSDVSSSSGGGGGGQQGSPIGDGRGAAGGAGGGTMVGIGGKGGHGGYMLDSRYGAGGGGGGGGTGGMVIIITDSLSALQITLTAGNGGNGGAGFIVGGAGRDTAPGSGGGGGGSVGVLTMAQADVITKTLTAGTGGTAGISQGTTVEEPIDGSAGVAVHVHIDIADFRRALFA